MENEVYFWSPNLRNDVGIIGRMQEILNVMDLGIRSSCSVVETEEADPGFPWSGDVARKFNIEA